MRLVAIAYLLFAVLLFSMAFRSPPRWRLPSPTVPTSRRRSASLPPP